MKNFHEMSSRPRYIRWLVVTSGVLLGTATMYAAGCSYDCEEGITCPTSASTGEGAGGGGSGGAGSGPGGGGDFNCDPTIGKEVDNSCGVWASSGEDTNGLHPHATTLGEAIDKLAPRTAGQPKNVYACIETFKENITLPGGVTLWGALDCNNNWYWHSDNPKTVLMPPDALPVSIPLTVKNDPNDLNSAAVVDFIITAAPATVPGGSSIAVAVDSATATFTRCDLSAGDAMAGAAGASGGAQMVSTAGMNGGNGGDAGAGSAIGGTIGSNTCGPDSLAGGEGGAGAPSGSANQGGGGDGADGANGGHGDNGSGCANGEDGLDGDKDQPLSSGASGAGIGDITMSGYVGVNGDHGETGHYGTSGGGGGGTKAAAAASGGGGGGGGAGGCGGLRGEGGQAGGSSIALVSVNANVTMNGCTLKAGLGGNGGAGGAGQPGQLGGSGGKGGNVSNGPPGCAGGKGGNGGNGSNGGDGHGGHSLGIAMKNGKLNMAVAPTALGTPGTGGLAKECWDFTAPPDGNECALSSEPPPG
jgi:hypothetical protein